MDKTSGRRRSRDGWATTVAKFERSGLSHAAFCEQERLTLGTFRTWLYQLRTEGRAASPGFVELGPVDAPGARCVVRVGAVELEFSATPDAPYLAALVSALERGAR